MNPGIEYDNLVKQLLPPHKRQRVRLWLLWAFVLPLREMFEAFLLLYIILMASLLQMVTC